jgi:hypothetical protein
MYSSDFSFFHHAMAETLVSCDVVDQQGQPIGAMAGFWLDPSTRRVAYIAVKSSTFPYNCHVVPALDTQIESDDTIRINYPSDHIRRAPIARPGLELAQVEKEEVNAYYEKFVPLKRIASIEKIRPEKALRAFGTRKR